LVAYIPFIVERCYIGKSEQYIVVKQLYGFEDIPIGAVISHWNGIPIGRQVRRLATESQGANQAASLRLGLANLTIRPLEYVLMPDEDWVTLSYYNASGELCTTSTPWRIYEDSSLGPVSTTVKSGNVDDIFTKLGIDSQIYIINNFKKISISNKEPEEKKKRITEKPCLNEHPLGILWGKMSTKQGDVGYMRIFTFEVPDASEFINVCENILKELPQDRLIIDVRGNPGGLIPAGQKFIRMLTSKDLLSTSPVAFRNTLYTRKLGNLPAFDPWRLSLDLQYATGQNFTQTLPITTFEDVPEYRYPGKIALVIDALCYSTTDFFCADFKDNEIGIIIGIDPQTGGGGANVWTWDVLQYFTSAVGGQLKDLPGDFSVNLSMRRSVRTGVKSGIPVEDLGVSADFLYYPTLQDAFSENSELLEYTALHMS
jgi:hypothetical protein